MNTYKEIKNIEKDVVSIKNNAVDLTHRLGADAAEGVKELEKSAVAGLKTAKEYSGKQVKVVEAYVQEKPLQGIAMAFAAGALLHFILGRR